MGKRTFVGFKRCCINHCGNVTRTTWIAVFQPCATEVVESVEYLQIVKFHLAVLEDDGSLLNTRHPGTNNNNSLPACLGNVFTACRTARLLYLVGLVSGNRAIVGWAYRSSIKGFCQWYVLGEAGIATVQRRLLFLVEVHDCDCEGVVGCTDARSVCQF